MKKCRIPSGAIKYSLCVFVTLLLVSIALVGAVYGKYTSKKQMSLDITVEAYGEIDLALRAGQTATDWADAPHLLYVAPGASFTYDPNVFVGANSESCYLFVKVEESGGALTFDSTDYEFSDFIVYSVDSGWTRGDGVNIPSNVFYRTVEKSGADQYFRVITGDTVSCPQSLRKPLIDAFTAETVPSLTVTAYAVQIANLTDPSRDNLTAAGAWAWIEAN